MNLDTMLVIGCVALGAVALGWLLLRFGKALARWLLILGGLGVAGAVALAIFAQARATQAVARVAQVQAVTTAGLSAAGAVTAFLVGVIVALALLIGGAFFGWRWWQKRQREERYRETLGQVQLYAALNGGQRVAYHRPALPYQQPAGGPVIVLPGQYPAQSGGGITLDDLALALQAAQGGGDPFADLLPPGDWEALQ